MSTRILAIDTATEACSVALLNEDRLLAHFELCAREHTQRILPLVQQILQEGGVALKDLDALAFGRGPAVLPVCVLASALLRGYRWGQTCR
ncbi:hypothetical protein ERHA55_30200 [Erwinia rhapontici]|nr:hypothetical protein ERHA55_30200 [Erwinia rhapontici]